MPLLRGRAGLAPVALVLAALVSPAAPIRAGVNPFDVRVASLARDVERLGSSVDPGATARATIPLLEIIRNRDWATPALVTRELEALATSPKVPASRRSLAGFFLAEQRFRGGELPRAREAFRDLGFVTDWRVVGPFDNEGKNGFAATHGPEEERSAPWIDGVSYLGKERDVSWRAYEHASPLPFVDLGARLRPSANVCAYAETFVSFERGETRSLWVGAAGAVRVWWNGQPVLEDAAYAGAFPDRHVAMVAARAGWNRVLVKNCVAGGGFGFYLRVGDRAGGAPGVFERDASTHRALGAPFNEAAPGGVTADLATLSAAAFVGAAAPAANPSKAAKAPPAEALEALAKHLDYTRAEDPADARAKDFAEQAARAKPSVDRWLLAARLSTERGDRMRFLAAAQRLAPKDPRVLLLAARVKAAGPRPYDALALLDGVPAKGIAHVQAEILRAQLLGDLDLPEAALAAVNRAHGAVGDVPEVLRALARYRERAGRIDGVIEAQTRLAELSHGEVAARRALLEDALRRGDTDRAVALLDQLRSTAASEGDSIVYLARTAETLGRGEEALALYAQARALAPDDADVLLTEAQFHLRQGRADAARDVLKRAQALRPQDPKIRELLSRLAPTKREDESYAAPSGQILKRRGTSKQAAKYAATVLHDLTVHTVYESGLGSEFHQIAAQVHNDEGVRAWRTFSIPFEPGRQSVDVLLARVHRRNGSVLEATSTVEQQLGEPWYRIYYDTRALVVVFPPLEWDDTVELRYRVSDTTKQNMFGDYFGDLHLFQSDSPKRHVEYVLLAPKKRTFYWREPKLPRLESSHEENGAFLAHRYAAVDVAPVHSEPDMPGATEVSAYLHVSTYKSWQDVGRWWWGLIQDQLHADARIKAAVKESTAGVKTTDEKVRRIYDWVVSNTRYVGLEFGIHGYKPYRSSLVVQRGFGDCKDKASLLYVMFREAGIDARIVLLRTTRNGAIASEPASLSIFDHAIAYVPELDLFLDGTAENSGSRELPDMDQGAEVLVVGPRGAEFRAAPVLSSSSNVSRWSEAISLDATGAATVRGTMELRGGAAPSMRERFEAEGTQRERLEEWLRGGLPGVTVKSATFGGLADREAPVKIRYEASHPTFARVEGGKLVVPVSASEAPSQIYARASKRNYPLMLGSPSETENTRVLTAPAGYVPENADRTFAATSPFGTISLEVATVKGAGGATEVRATTKRVFKVHRVEPGDYGAFRAWLEKADAALRGRVTFAKAVVKKEAP
jgi:transglutaminase-like putative cysteine protease/predicted Zn-dependent protease